MIRQAQRLDESVVQGLVDTSFFKSYVFNILRHLLYIYLVARVYDDGNFFNAKRTKSLLRIRICGVEISVEVSIGDRVSCRQPPSQRIFAIWPISR